MKRTVGILGGSFNPPHLGHLHIARTAKEQLQLDEVWLLITPQNPSKPKKGMAPFELRKQLCDNMAHHIDWLKVSTFEHDRNINITHLTLKMLVEAYPDIQFVWIMGSENMALIHDWHGWNDIFMTMPIVLVNRFEAHQSAAEIAHTHAAKAFELCQAAPNAPIGTAPEWRLLTAHPHTGCATNIREELRAEKKAKDLPPSSNPEVAHLYQYYKKN